METLNGYDLVSKDVRCHLENLVQNLGVTNHTTTISQGTIRGDNYLGIIAKATVNGRNAQNKEDVRLNFIIKSAPRQGIVRAKGVIREAYEREIFIYNKVFPVFSQLQDEHGIKKRFDSYAKFYDSSMTDMNEALIMEDMKSIGFRMRERSEPLDYDHVLLVLREYGRLHALSYALRDQKPHVFEGFAPNLQENLFKVWNSDKDISEAMKTQLARALDAFDPVQDEELYKKLQNFIETGLDKIVELMDSKATGKYGVICHGDNWVNNMLFKYDDSRIPLQPTHVCLLDWQLSRIGSPALDLSYFIFTSTDKKLRDEHYNDLINEYYQSLSIFLRELGGDSHKLFPFEVLQEHLKQFSMFGLYMAMMVLYMMMSDVEEIPDLHDIKFENKDLKSFNFQTKNVDKYNVRIKDVVVDFVRFNYNL